MKEGRKKYGMLLACMLVIIMMVTGCGGNNADSDEADKNSTKVEPSTVQTEAPIELAPVELTYYYPGAPQRDLMLVEEAMNKILTEKINTTIKLKAMDWGALEQKVNVMSAAGEEYDLVFTAPWFNNYFLNVSKGAYVELDDLLLKYAPTLYSSIPAEIWNATRVNGKIYGSINYQIVAMPFGFDVRKDLADKYQLDIDAVKKYEDLEPFFDKVLAGEKGVTPSIPLDFKAEPVYHGMDEIGETRSPGWYRIDDPTAKVINQYATPEFKNTMEMGRRWREKGYFRKDAIGDLTAELKAGKFATLIHWPAKPGGEFDEKTKNNFDGYPKALTPALVTTNRVISTMTAISASSKNPERAAMFLELINTDKDLYNLLCNGIEGKHYKFTDKEKGVIGIADGEDPANRGYAPGSDWMFGNQFNGYFTSIDAVGNWEKTIELNKTATVSPLLGFNFNPEPVKTELTLLVALVDEYVPYLESGIGDDAKYEQFIKKLEASGLNKLMEEKQKQIDEWMKTKK
ncbi:MAG: ABC transporter substrate-binding protein [Gorillibacterium sp.]|nr:ABC transporter substrate-binding protein [Gorillibacterium sp.]